MTSANNGLLSAGRATTQWLCEWILPGLFTMATLVCLYQLAVVALVPLLAGEQGAAAQLPSVISAFAG